VSRLLATPLYLHCTLSRLFCQQLRFLTEKFFERGNTVSFSLHFVKSCAMLSVVQPAPRQAVPPRRFPSGGESFFFTPNLYREGVADMIVTWSDLIQFCILIFAILAYAESKKK